MCFSYSLSHQPQQTGQCSFQLGEWSQRQQAEPTPSTPFSALYHAFVLFHVPHFPSCNISFSLPFFFLSAHFPPLWGCTPALGPGPPLSLPVSSVLSNGFFRAFPAFCFLPVHFPHIFPLSDLALSYTLPGCSHLNTQTIMPLVRLIVHSVSSLIQLLQLIPESTIAHFHQNTILNGIACPSGSHLSKQ